MTDSKKVYLHYEEKDPVLCQTVVFPCRRESTVRDAIEAFTLKANKRTESLANSTPFDPDYLMLTTLEFTYNVSSHNFNLFDNCDGGDDLFIVKSTVRQSYIPPKVETKLTSSSPAVVKSPPVTTPSSSSSTTTTTPSSSSASVKAPKPAAVAASLPEESSTRVSSEELTKIKNELRIVISAKSYRKAREACESLLASGAKSDTGLQNLYIETLVLSGQLEKSVTAAERTIRLANFDATTYYLLGKALNGQKNFEESEVALLRALEMVEKKPGNYPKDFKLTISALLAETVYDGGRHSDAAEIVNPLVTTPAGFVHVPLLLAYSRFAFEYEKVEEPMQAMLKAVTLDQKNERVNELLSKLLSTERGMMELMKQVPPTGNAATVSQAYAFVATIARDHSVFSASKTLFALALQKRPESASYALNLAHVHENVCELKLAVLVIHQFFLSNPRLRIGQHGPDCAALADAMAEAVAALSSKTTTSKKDDKKLVSDSSFFPETLSYVDWLEDSEGGYCLVREVRKFDPNEPEADIEISTSSIIAGGSNEGRPSYDKIQYQDRDLDILALGFTAVKVLYHLGELKCLPALYRLLEPARNASQTAVHMTSIRNEHAYYQCIAQVLAVHPQSSLFCTDLPGDDQISPGEASLTSTPSWENIKNSVVVNPSSMYPAAYQRPIYFCGDSHTIPAAWAVINVADCQRLLIPKLVTGVKQWHLRPKSNFYPKAHFLNTVKSIPDNAEVIFNIGEIDCREGLLVAIERDQYSSLEHGMTETIKIFAAVLNDLIKKRKFKVYVHPILPVLNETRSHVLIFNRIYKQIVTNSVKGATWLEFVDEVLLPDQTALAPGLALDGTHMHPIYLRKVERCLNEISQAAASSTAGASIGKH